MTKSHQFADTGVGITSVTASFELKNSGSLAASSCLAPVLSNNVDFSISSDGCGTSNLDLNTSCIVTVAAHPSIDSIRTATLSRTCGNAGTISTFNEEITVTGVVAQLNWDQLTYNFGTLSVPGGTSSRSFILTNTGGTAATGCSSPTLSNSTDFSITSSTCGTADLGASQSCSVTVEAHPSGLGTTSTTLQRVCTSGGTASTNGNQLVTLGAAPSLAWDLMTHNFGNSDIGVDTSIQDFILTNSGGASATGCSAPTLSNSTDFAIVSNTCGVSNLDPATTCTVRVRANPTSSVLKVSTLSRTCTYGGTISTTANEITVTGNPGPPTQITVFSGDNQTATVGTGLASPQVALVTDAWGTVTPGVTVDWIITTGSGMISTLSSTTDSSGRASNTFTIGGAPGANVLTAKISGTNYSVGFTGTGTPAAVNRIFIVDGQEQVGTTSTLLAKPLKLRATDAYGSPISGVSITWVVMGGGGTLSNHQTTTDINGHATADLTLGSSVGDNIVWASSSVGVLEFLSSSGPRMHSILARELGEGSTLFPLRFFMPQGLATDSLGNFYLSDQTNTIRKIHADGTAIYLAGLSHSNGYVDGPMGESRIGTTLKGIALDGVGNLYFPDGSKIRKISASGVTSTVAGSSVPGMVNDVGVAARFTAPYGLTVDPTGIIYVADTGNHAIRKIALDGTVTTFAGLMGSSGSLDGTGAAARFSSPRSIIFDPSSNLLYVNDYGNKTMRKITLAGEVSLLAGAVGVSGNANGPGPNARFEQPQQLAVDKNGNIIVPDWYGDSVRRISPAGVVSALAGGTFGYINGTGASARFSGPMAVAVDAAGNVYVAERDNAIIRKITPAALTSLHKGTVAANAVQTYYIGMTIDGLGNLYHFNGNELRKTESNGTTTIIATLGAFLNSRQVVIDSNGDFFIANSDAYGILKVTSGGVVTRFAGSGVIGTTNGTGLAARFTSPYYLSIDADDNLYVSDGHAIRKITPAAEVTTLAGVVGTSGSTDGTGSGARFNAVGPSVLAPDGHLYVADRTNYLIRKVSSTGVVTTFLGSLGVTGHIDGTGTAAQLGVIGSMAIGPDGKIYVGSSRAIRRFTTSGTIETYMGSANRSGLNVGMLPGSLTQVFSLVFHPITGQIYFSIPDNIITVY